MHIRCHVKEKALFPFKASVLSFRGESPTLVDVCLFSVFRKVAVEIPII